MNSCKRRVIGSNGEMVDINNTNGEFKTLLYSFQLERDGDTERARARVRVCLCVSLCGEH
jgi:hypothetical protein